MNTRLQVEHGVTEEVTGIDLVEWMVRQAAGELPPLDQASIKPRGASIQVRLYAEDPGRDFRPSAGLLTACGVARRTRASRPGSRAASEVSPFYDPLLAKIIVTGATRDEALSKLAGRARRDRDRRARDQPRLPAATVAASTFSHAARC